MLAWQLWHSMQPLVVAQLRQSALKRFSQMGPQTMQAGWHTAAQGSSFGGIGGTSPLP
jgi:hypothetical protein